MTGNRGYESPIGLPASSLLATFGAGKCQNRAWTAASGSFSFRSQSASLRSATASAASSCSVAPCSAAQPTCWPARLLSTPAAPAGLASGPRQPPARDPVLAPAPGHAGCALRPPRRCETATPVPRHRSPPSPPARTRYRIRVPGAYQVAVTVNPVPCSGGTSSLALSRRRASSENSSDPGPEPNRVSRQPRL